MTATQIRGSTQIIDSTVTVAKLNMDADLPMASHKITGLATPTLDGDAATKAYVDGLTAPTYTWGNGLSASGDTINVGGGDGMSIAADGISVNIDTAAGLKFDASSPKKIQINLTASGGLAFDAGALGIDLDDNSGLTLGAGGLSVAPKVNGGLVKAADGLSVDATLVAKKADIFFNETPTGLINGSNKAYTLLNTPTKLMLFLNGILLQPGAGNDYQLATNTVTMEYAPTTGDKLLACYIA